MIDGFEDVTDLQHGSLPVFGDSAKCGSTFTRNRGDDEVEEFVGIQNSSRGFE